MPNNVTSQNMANTGSKKELYEFVDKLISKSFGRLVIEKHEKHYHVEETEKRRLFFKN